jgi:HD-like signal output (HDOD) protein/ActR/RegA family two-component response regulator
MDKKKALFVDDEHNVLDGLRRMLRPLRNQYDIQFASGGRQALELMAGERFDVIISDMRMPGMDGAELLETVQKQYPHTIRIMLTGQADENSILRTVGVVHQFLAKPCDPERLKTILAQAGALQEILSDGGLKDLISQIGTLPSLPTTYAKLQKAVATPEVEINEVGRIIERDIAMTAKVLQLVNSAFFGIYTKVDSPIKAVKLLGLDTIKVLVLGLEIFSQIKISKDIFPIELLWSRSLAVGKIAKAIAARVSDDKDLISNAFIAGILHDIGKLILISHLPARYRQVIDLARVKNITLPEAEQEVFGAWQGAVGAYLIGLWGFVQPIIEALGFHAVLDRYPATAFTPALAVHVARILYFRNCPEEIIGRSPELYTPALENLGLLDRVGAWQEMAAEIMKNEEGD